MARLQRVTSKVFAENATEVGQFGSLNAGTKVTTTDIATIQGLPAWQNGWQAATVGENCYPTLQERNGLDKVQSYFLNYLLQEGIPEWDSGTTYYTGSIVKLINGTNVQLYQSLIDNNTSALSVATAWKAYNYADRTLSNVTSLSNNIQTLLNAIYANRNIAVTHTANTQVGSSTNPVYVSSSGVATACNFSWSTIHAVTTTYNSGNSWYRVWSDGWKEQGGLTTASTNKIHTVSFLRPFSNTYYTALVCVSDTVAATVKTWSDTQIVTKTTTGMTIGNNNSTSRSISWYACGY